MVQVGTYVLKIKNPPPWGDRPVRVLGECRDCQTDYPKVLFEVLGGSCRKMICSEHAFRSIYAPAPRPEERPVGPTSFGSGF